MKIKVIVLLLLLLTGNLTFSKTYTITNSSFSFTPSSLTINLGDTVKFVLASIHNAQEVDQTTWNANGSTSNGGFALPFGGGTVVLTTEGTHYYVCVPHAAFGMKGVIIVDPATDVKRLSSINPHDFSLMQNYPNPFNPITKITFQIPNEGLVQLNIYDVLGNEIKTLVNESMRSGKYSVDFDASKLASGVYFYLLKAGSYTNVKKMILIK